MGIKYLSLYTFSEENWNRPAAEIEGLMKLMVKAMAAEKPTMMKNNVRFRVIGNRDRLSKDVLSQILKLEEDTAQNSGLLMIVMLSYSGKWDIMQAAHRYAQAYSEDHTITPDKFESCLATSGIPDPDLLIRTSGEQRISNYMLWQCAYTEFYYTDVLWPDFGKEDFKKAIDTYENRDRRYGKVK
jgi:undecaprenyl diphosphate synthase